jgi:hypothetical protein
MPTPSLEIGLTWTIVNLKGDFDFYFLAFGEMVLDTVAVDRHLGAVDPEGSDVPAAVQREGLRFI